MMMRSTDKHFRGVTKYDSEREGWSSYVESIELFFIANDETDKAKKIAMLLNCCGIATCRIFKGLTAPAKPTDKNFSELKDHQNPKRNPITERFLFKYRKRKLDKNILTYMAELCRLWQYCKYQDSAEEMLHNWNLQFPVAGIFNLTSSSYIKRE